MSETASVPKKTLVLPFAKSDPLYKGFVTETAARPILAIALQEEYAKGARSLSTPRQRMDATVGTGPALTHKHVDAFPIP